MQPGLRPIDLMFSLRADLFLIAARFAPLGQRGGGRPEIRGVRVEPSATGGVVLAAGDTQAMLVLHDRSGVTTRAATVTLQRPLVDRARDLVKGRGGKTQGAAVRLACRDGRVAIEGDGDVTAALDERPGR